VLEGQGVKIYLLSDLHLEFHPFTPDPRASEACDVVVLAGDIDHGSKVARWARKAFSDKPIVHVFGNHEFYKGHWDRCLEVARQESLAHGVVLLENEKTIIGDTRFLGCTLWTDFDYLGQGTRKFAMERYEQGLNDCRLIRASRLHRPVGLAHEYGRLTAKHVLARHVASRRWLEEELATPFAGTTVVVTHHLPCAESVPDRYKNNDLTPGFASRLPTELMVNAAVWLHGHTHEGCDYRIAGTRTRVICNPRGYPLASGAFENSAFNPNLLIDV
jgi:predicted phosphodiesterase